MPNFRKSYFDARSVTFTDPSNFNNTNKVTIDTGKSNIGQVQLRSVRSTIHLSRREAIPVEAVEGCCPTAPQYMSTRAIMEVSGFTEHPQERKQLLLDLIYVSLLTLDDSSAGFVPYDVVIQSPATAAMIINLLTPSELP